MLGLHALLFIALYSVLYCFGILTAFPDGEHLANWDVGALRAISLHGYATLSDEHKAFFPLLPYVWRWLQLSVVGISLLNATCTFVGLYIVGQAFRLSSRQLLLLSCSPLLMLGFVPYTEGLFFLFAALLLSGLHRRQLALTLLGLFGCCLARSAATLFIPAYLFAELLAWGYLSTGWVFLRNLVAGLAVMAASLALVIWLQASPGSNLFAFYTSHASWGQVLRLPSFPLHTSAGPPMLWLDATGLVASLLSLCACAVLGLRWVAQRLRGTTKAGTSKAILFSLGYFVGAGFFIVFYQGGDLVGMSRYTMGSAFWGVLLVYVWQAAWPWRWALSLLVLIWLSVAIACGFPSQLQSFNPGESLWYFGLWLAYMASYWFSQPSRSPWFREISTGLYFFNLLMLAYLFNQFMNKIWVN